MPTEQHAADERYVVFADFLGTTRRYAKPSLVQRSRELLEQVLAQCVVPRLKPDDMNLYVFSDTTIITCPTLAPLAKTVSILFRQFIQLMASDEDDESLTLWLRAGISIGSILQVDHLKNNRRIRTIPFLDTSLPKAYRLEQIRKGSRIFVDPEIDLGLVLSQPESFYKWRQITGHGDYVPNVGEILWPVLAFDTHQQMADAATLLHTGWLRALREQFWEKDDYIDRMLHLDETIKLFARSVCQSCNSGLKNGLLMSMLPEGEERRNSAKYEWGLWFQALRGLAEDPHLRDTAEVLRAFASVEAILRRENLYQHFTNELNYPDYHTFRDALTALGSLGPQLRGTCYDPR